MEKFSVEAIYEVMEHIPKGKVVSYGEIATLIGWPNMSRHVGSAMRGAYQKGLPCHRVVFADGRLVQGWAEQSELLKAEGVIMKTDRRVDMETSAWRPLETIDTD